MKRIAIVVPAIEVRALTKDGELYCCGDVLRTEDGPQEVVKRYMFGKNIHLILEHEEQICIPHYLRIETLREAKDAEKE